MLDPRIIKAGLLESLRAAMPFVVEPNDVYGHARTDALEYAMRQVEIWFQDEVKP